MNKKLQRLLCMLLAAAIMAGMMPAQVFAVFSCGHDVRNCSWHPCKDREKHQYMCDKCGKIFKIEEHDPDGDRKNFDYPTIGVEGHEQRCTKCGYWWDMEPHAYGYKDMVVNGATHPNVPVCLYCGYSPATTVPEKFLHKYSWHTKGGGHVYACEYCGYGSDGKANPTVFEHHYVLTRDNHSHWEVCAICGDAKFKSAHNMKLTGEFDEPITPTTTKHHKVYSCTKEGCNFSYWDNPPKDEYCDHTHCHYESIGNQHQYVCDNCGEVLSTSNHSINTSKVWKAEEVEQYFAANDKTQNPHDHMMSFYSSGHMSRCYECTAGVWERHTWKGSDASDENICVVYCEKCGYNRTAAIKVTDDDPDPHTYFKFDPIFKSSDKNIAPIQDPSIECSYTTRGGGRHSMKCEVCGYEHKEKCDSDGWVESDTPGKHWSFCSKCGGNMHLTECTEGYRQTATLGTGRHEVYCKVCNEIVSPSRPCQYQVYDDGTENYTNGTQHTFRCTLCGNEWTGNHIRKTIKENYVASVPGRQGHYDEVTVCELCGMELTREVKNLAPVASGNDNFADVVVRQKSVIKDNSDMVDADTALATGAYSNNLSRYVAEHASDFLGSDFTMPTSFYDENNGLINSGIYVVIEPVINVTITDYTLDEDDDDGDDNTQEFRSMTADISLTYNAYAAAEVNGVERRDPTYIKSNVPFDPTEPINFCVPVLNIESSQTALVDHEHNGVINTYAGVYASDKGMATVDFTTENGCSTFTFKPSDYWLEYIPREEPTKTSQGRIECWYARNLNKFYTDIECTNEVSYDDTFIPVINDTSCTVTFESGVYEHNPNKAPNVTGSMGVVYVDKGTEITLPTTCGYKSAGAIKGTSNTGYYFENYYDDVFIGWKIGDTNYEPGDTCTITGDTVVKARWQNNWVKNLVTLVFDANGGEGTMENQLVLRDAPDTIKPNTYTRDGYFFAGWGKTSTAVGAVYDDNGTYTFANHATLYAIWKPIFTVTYHTNGGEGEMEPQLFSASLYPGQDYYYVIAKLNANTFTREGYIFKGWSKTPNAVYSSYNDINYYDAASPILKETDLGGRSLDLYALWAVDTAYKPDVSSLISMDNKTVAYNGQAQTIEPTIDFSGQDEYTQGSSPTWTYDYYSGYEVSEETKLDSAPVNVGTYTVVATYNDGKNTGKKDRYLWIKKAERTLEISNEQLDLYGTGATITLTVSDDADNSAKDALTLYNQINENVVTLGDITWNGNTATIPITYVGPGYTHQLFTLDTSDNYIGTNAGVVVSAYSGYRVNLDHNKGGYLSTDKTRAMPNTEVTLTTRPYTGYKLDNLTVTNKATGENIAVTNGKFTMPAADVEVNVEYTQEEYTVNYTDVDGVTYTTQPMAAHYGDNITVSASIDSTDKVIKGFEYTSGGSTLSSNIQLNAAEEYSFRMPAKNVTVKAVTDKPYDVYTDESITNGSVQATPAQAAQGMIVKIMPTANDGYTLSKISCVYTGGSTEVPVKVSVDALGEKTYTITMPNHDVTIGAEFVSSASMATDNVADEAAAEKGASTADIEVAADDDTLEMLTNAALSVDVDFVLSGSGIVITDEDKADALSALATAGLTDGSDDIRIVEKNFMNV
ncbi:MAG: InlB B-repeat-containing protein, partial [Firmicutes bacterium]|nr:InlB B-repeat-containing protein [Bacillota bacterium]